jgi:hypothetical protein
MNQRDHQTRFLLTQTRLAALLGLSAVAMNASIAMAAEGNSTTARVDNGIEATIPVGSVLPNSNITLEAHRLPLGEVMAAVRKQTGVTFSIAPATFLKEPKLTLAITELPLREWMESLAEMYGARWEAIGDNSFRLQSAGLSETEKGLKRIGSWYNYWRWSFQEGKRPDYLPQPVVPDWKDLVDNNLDLKAIATTGVSFTDAPPELQQAVREVVERSNAIELLTDALLLNATKGPLYIFVERPDGESGFILNAGKRNEKEFLGHFP